MKFLIDIFTLLTIGLCVSSLDTRCDPRNGVECSNFIFSFYYPHNYMIHFKVGTESTISFQELHEECDCSCNCTCEPRSSLQSFETEGMQMIPSEASCIQLISSPGNLSACCIYLHGHLEETSTVKSYDTTPTISPTRKTPPPSSNLWSVLVSTLCFVISLMVLIVFLLIKKIKLRQDTRNNETTVEAANTSSTTEAHFLLVYANKDQHFQKFANRFVSIIEGAINGCKVYDIYQCAGELCEDGPGWLIPKVNECDKVIVFLSPAVLDLQSKGNQKIDDLDPCEKVTHFFFSKLLIELHCQEKVQCQEKLVFVSLEISIPLAMTLLTGSRVYTLPKKLKELVKHLAPCTNDEGKLQQYEKDLVKAMSLVGENNGSLNSPIQDSSM